MNNYTKLLAKHLSLFARDRTKKTGEPPREKTINAHRLQLEPLCYKLDSDETTITVTVLKEWIISLSERTGQSNINQALTAITNFLKFLADDAVIPRDMLEGWADVVSRYYRPVKPASLRRRMYLESHELEEILFKLSQHTANKVQRDRDVAFFGAVLMTGTRVGDLRRATLGNVKHESSQILRDDNGQPLEVPKCIVIHLEEHQTKDRKLRDLVVFQGELVGGVEIYSYLDNYLVWRKTKPNAGPDGPVFTSSKRPGDFITDRNQHKGFKRAASDLGIRLTPHMLRGTFAEVSDGYLNPRDTRQILGHNAQKTTQGYTDQPNKARLLKARLRASQAISNY